MKRFIDTGLVQQEWYAGLEPKKKALYIHLLCICDPVGMFDISPRMFSMFIGDSITEDDVFNSFGGRVKKLSDTKGLIVDFVSFQCGGELRKGCRPHESIYRLILKAGLTIDKLNELSTKHNLRSNIENTTGSLSDGVGNVDGGKADESGVVHKPTHEVSVTATVPAGASQKDATPEDVAGRSTARFTPPTVQEVKAYCDERHNNVDPQAFIDFYESKGWMIGKNKMKEWQACVRTWERGSFKRGSSNTNTNHPSNWRGVNDKVKHELSGIL